MTEKNGKTALFQRDFDKLKQNHRVLPDTPPERMPKTLIKAFRMTALRLQREAEQSAMRVEPWNVFYCISS